MYFIAVLESKKSEVTALKIFRLLQKKYKVLYLEGDEVIMPENDDYDFVVSGYSELPKIKGGKGIIIFTDRFVCEKKRTIPENFTLLYSNYNKSADEIVKCSQCSFVTVGYSSKDSVNISGEGEGESVISITISLDTLDKNIFLPCDIAVRHNEKDGSNVLFAVLILIISDKIKEEKELFLL